MNPLQHLAHLRIILGSASPRRKELIDKLGLSYEVITSNVDEIIPDGMPAHEAPEYLARLKADDLKQQLKGEYLMITADTVVIAEGKVLGKPKDLEDAATMLSRLQDNVHDVVSSVCITTPHRQESFSDLTKVKLSAMTQQEIMWYALHFPVLDKAGSYGIQDWIGVTKVGQLDGSYYNVMGLPMHILYEHLISW